jgi:hypothetical protein
MLFSHVQMDLVNLNLKMMNLYLVSYFTLIKIRFLKNKPQPNALKGVLKKGFDLNCTSKVENRIFSIQYYKSLIFCFRPVGHFRYLQRKNVYKLDRGKYKAE